MTQPLISFSWTLADRGRADDPHPRYEDFPNHEAYEQAFHMWRAQQRDGRLNDEELAAKFAVIEDAVLNRPKP